MTLKSHLSLGNGPDPRYLYSLQWVSGVMDNSPDPGCGWAMDPDMSPCCSQGMDVNMILVAS